MRCCSFPAQMLLKREKHSLPVADLILYHTLIYHGAGGQFRQTLCCRCVCWMSCSAEWGYKKTIQLWARTWQVTPEITPGYCRRRVRETKIKTVSGSCVLEVKRSLCGICNAVDGEKPLLGTYSRSVSSPVLSLQLQGSEVKWESGLGGSPAFWQPAAARTWVENCLCVCWVGMSRKILAFSILSDSVDIENKTSEETKSAKTDSSWNNSPVITTPFTKVQIKRCLRTFIELTFIPFL